MNACNNIEPIKEFDITIKKIITTKCELLVHSSVANDVPGVMYFEFLEGPGLKTIDTKNVSDYQNLLTSTYKQKLDEDGLYMYYCLQVKTKDSLLNDPDIELSERVYCDQDTNDDWVLYNGETIVTTDENLDEIFKNYTRDDVGLVSEPIFSICRLHNCLENKLRSYVFDTIKTCEQYPECNKDSYNDYIRNFLFSTVFVLRELICQAKYSEACNILESINRCHGICEDTRSSSNKCNCGC